MISPLLRAENAELRTLLTIQGDLSHGATPKEVLQEVVGHVHAALGASRSYALLREAVGGRFEPAATAGLSDAAVTALKRFFPGPQPLPAHRQRPDRPTGRWSWLSRRRRACCPRRSSDDLGMTHAAAGADPGAGARRDRRSCSSTSSAPPMARRRSPPERVRLAGAVAGQLTLLLENAILYEQLRRRTQRLEALNEIGLALAAAASSEPGGPLRAPAAPRRRCRSGRLSPGDPR